MATSRATRRPGASRLLSLSGAGAVVLVVASFAGLGGDTPGSERLGREDQRRSTTRTRRARSSPRSCSPPPRRCSSSSGSRLALASGRPKRRRRPFWHERRSPAGSAARRRRVPDRGVAPHRAGQTANVRRRLGRRAAGAQRPGRSTLGRLQQRPRRDDARRGGLRLLASRAYPVLGWIALAAGIALLHPVRRLRRAHRQRALDHHDERAALPQPACGVARATTRIGVAGGRIRRRAQAPWLQPPRSLSTVASPPSHPLPPGSPNERERDVHSRARRDAVRRRGGSRSAAPPSSSAPSRRSS